MVLICQSYLHICQLNQKIIKEAKVEVYHLSYYIKWDPQEVFYYAAEKAGLNLIQKESRKL